MCEGSLKSCAGRQQCKSIQEFTCRAAVTLEETKELIEAGFEYVTDLEDKKLFRKRK